MRRNWTHAFGALSLVATTSCLVPDPDPRFTPAWERVDLDEEPWKRTRTALVIADCQIHISQRAELSVIFLELLQSDQFCHGDLFSCPAPMARLHIKDSEMPYSPMELRYLKKNGQLRPPRS